MSEDETSEGEDWFEKALEDDDASDVDPGVGTEEPTETASDDAVEPGDETDDETASDGDEPDESDEKTAPDSEESADGDETTERGAFDSGDAFGGTDRSIDGTPDDSAFDDAVGGREDGGAVGDDGDSAFGGNSGGGAFGGGEPAIDEATAEPFEDESGLFDDDFASAFESSGDEFKDEEFESSIPRIDIGIEGLDDMIQGGIPERHLIVTIGAAGAGKTTFGLQFLHHGLQQGEHGVFITLEQSRETIVDTANERGWEFDRYEREDKLAVVDLDPVEMANSLDNIRGELPQLIKDFDADRLVLDSVSLLEMMYDDQARRRTEVFDFTRSLKRAGVTTFLTSEANESNPYASRHGIIEYLTDAVFILQYVRGESRETRLAVEIQKIRNANHSREQKPYDITMDGISVYQQANIF